MELLNGRSMKEELAERGRLTVDDVRSILPGLCALQFAHDLGVVHRDLKPANVVAHEFATGRRAIRSSTGLAEHARDGRNTPDRPHEFLGTLAYASPEQLTGGVVDARSDIYSLGAVVFEMLTGRPPFTGADPMALLHAHVHDPVPRPSTFAPDVPAWLDVVVARALAKDPRDRWPSIAEFGAALGGAQGHSTTTIRNAAAPGGLLGTYELGERIGKGRLGSDVHRGTHRALGHPVAIRPRTHRNWKAGAIHMRRRRFGASSIIQETTARAGLGIS
jgi:serine/threonine-protein kinase